MPKTGKEMVKAIESKTGVSRPWRQILSELDPEFMDIQTQSYSYVFEKRKSLPLKFKEIIELCLDTVTGCEAGFRIHVRRAFKNGAKVEEILEAMEVTQPSTGIT